jgi:hypothetical protein
VNPTPVPPFRSALEMEAASRNLPSSHEPFSHTYEKSPSLATTIVEDFKSAYRRPSVPGDQNRKPRGLLATRSKFRESTTMKVIDFRVSWAVVNGEHHEYELSVRVGERVYIKRENHVVGSFNPEDVAVVKVSRQNL